MNRKAIILIAGLSAANVEGSTTFQDHLEFTKRWEGQTNRPYRDSTGHSIGVGHFIPKGKKVPAFWTEAQIKTAFIMDMSKAITGAKKIFKNFDTLPKEVRLIAADLCFCLGESGLRKFKKTIAACNRRDWKTMAFELKNSRWFKQTGNRGKNHVAQLSCVKG